MVNAGMDVKRDGGYKKSQFIVILLPASPQCKMLSELAMWRRLKEVVPLSAKIAMTLHHESCPHVDALLSAIEISFALIGEAAIRIWGWNGPEIRGAVDAQRIP